MTTGALNRRRARLLAGLPGQRRACVQTMKWAGVSGTGRPAHNLSGNIAQSVSEEARARAALDIPLPSPATDLPRLHGTKQ